jgi:hypothetical protein
MPPLLVYTIGFWVAGIVFLAIGASLKPRVRGPEAPTAGQIIITILGKMLTAVGQIVSGKNLGERFEGLGSLCMYAGLATFALWILVAAGLIGSGPGPTGTPTSS